MVFRIEPPPEISAVGGAQAFDLGRAQVGVWTGEVEVEVDLHRRHGGILPDPWGTS